MYSSRSIYLPINLVLKIRLNNKAYCFYVQTKHVVLMWQKMLKIPLRRQFPTFSDFPSFALVENIYVMLLRNTRWVAEQCFSTMFRNLSRGILSKLVKFVPTSHKSTSNKMSSQVVVSAAIGAYLVISQEENKRR